MAQVADAIRGEYQPRGCSKSLPIQDAGHLCVREFGRHLSNEVYQLGIGDVTVDPLTASLDLNRRNLTSNPVDVGFDVWPILGRGHDYRLD